MDLGALQPHGDQLRRTLAAVDGLGLHREFPHVAQLRRDLDLLLGAELERWLAEIPRAAGEASADLVRAGGKRLRPLLALLAAGAAGGEPRAGMPVAVAVELLHTATLLHDDVIDEGELRRGQPTARRVWGNAIAVLSGDFCFFAALDALSAANDLRLVQRAMAVGHRLVEGELIQLEARSGSFAITEAGYFAVIERKTASLFAFACSGGAMCGSDDAPVTAALERFGACFGTAFQIIDDVTDLLGDRCAAGKGLGQDLRQGYVTLPVLLAMQQRPEIDAAVHRLRRDLAAGAELDGRADAVMAAVRATDAAANCRARAAALAAEGVAALDALPASDYRAGLVELVAQAI